MKNTIQSFIAHLITKRIISAKKAADIYDEIDSFLSQSQPPTFCVFLDAGHGGLDGNGIYATLPDKCHQHKSNPLNIEFHNKAGWFYEGVWNRKITKAIAEKLKKKRIQYRFVMDWQKDTFLSTRVTHANQQAENFDNSIYISSHANAFNTWTQGFEVFTSPGQTDSDTLATFLMDEVKKLFKDRIKYRTDKSDGDVDKEEKFYVLTKTIMPAILIEYGFFDNYEEAAFLLDEDNIDLFATAVVAAIERYM